MKITIEIPEDIKDGDSVTGTVSETGNEAEPPESGEAPAPGMKKGGLVKAKGAMGYLMGKRKKA